MLNFTAILITPRPSLSVASTVPSGQFQFVLSGATGQNYVVQACTNLNPANWMTLLTTNSASFNSFLVTDPSATNQQRFYRVLVGP